MNDAWLIVPVLGGIACVIAAVHFAHKRRRAQFQALADSLGLAFFPGGDDALLDHLAGFHLLSRGRHPSIQNMLHGQTPQAEVAVFGFDYTTGSGKHSSTTHQTVLYMRAPSLKLPLFALRPEGLFNKIGQVLGAQDIDFDSHPAFSKQYLLKSEAESAVRDVFHDGVLTHIERQ